MWYKKSRRIKELELELENAREKVMSAKEELSRLVGAPVVDVPFR